VPQRLAPVESRPPGRVRKADTTDRILAAGLAILAEQGVDACSLPRVASRAGLTTGPLYSRFDEPDDLFIALWGTSLATRLDDLLAAIGGWLSGTEREPSQFLVTELDDPSETTSALVELLAGMRRYPYAAEQIRAEADAAYQRFVGSVAPLAPVLAGYGTSACLGRILLSPLLTPSNRGTALELLAIARRLAETTGMPVADASLLMSIDMPHITSGDAVTDEFLNAALRVIARGGYDKASANRIAREGGLSVSRAYGVFASKKELAAQALTAILADISTRWALGFVGIEIDAYRQMVFANGRAMSHPSSLQVRRLRLECALAARHYPDLRDSLRDAFEVTSDELERRLQRLAPEADPEKFEGARAMWHMLREVGFGVLVLEEAAYALSRPPDFGPLAVGMPQLYEHYVARPLGITSPTSA
jgi:AcrR family transcriptional regulator